MNKTITLAIGAAVGTALAPMVLNAVGIGVSDGFGMDDIVQALVIVAAIMVVDRIL